MSLFNSNSPKNPGNSPQIKPVKPASSPAQPVAVAPKPAAEKSFFGSKKLLNRMELREKLRKDTGKIPGAGSFYSKEQRVGLEENVFGKKFGQYITPVEFEKGLKDLNKQKFATKTSKEKLDIDRKIRFLKKLGEDK